MENQPTPNRLHPLIAGAAISVTLVSLLGAAAIAGILPNSHGNAAPANTLSAPAAQVAAPLPPAAVAPAPQVVEAPAPKTRVIEKTRVVYKTAPTRSKPAPQYAQLAPSSTPAYTQPVQQPIPAVSQSAPQAVATPAQQPPSMIGMAGGAVIGGLLGNQIGKGNGRKLATVAGIIGGGYVGNEVGKRNGF